MRTAETVLGVIQERYPGMRLLESRVNGNIYARFGGGLLEKCPQAVGNSPASYPTTSTRGGQGNLTTGRRAERLGSWVERKRVTVGQPKSGKTRPGVEVALKA